VTQVLQPHELLERDADLAAVRGLVAAAPSGTGRALVVEARSGLGKTRLLGEARAIAAEAGLTMLTARGSELVREFSYGVVRQLLEPALAAAGADERAELLSGAAVAP
jgi:AAA ATPase domain